MRGQGEHQMFFSHTVLFLLPTPSELHESRESTPDWMGLAVTAWLSAHHPWVPRKHLLKELSTTQALQSSNFYHGMLETGVGGKQKMGHLNL